MGCAAMSQRPVELDSVDLCSALFMYFHKQKIVSSASCDSEELIGFGG